MAIIASPYINQSGKATMSVHIVGYLVGHGGWDESGKGMAFDGAA